MAPRVPKIFTRAAFDDWVQDLIQDPKSKVARALGGVPSGLGGITIKGTAPDLASLPGTPVTPASASKNFTTSTAQIANPERGWFQYSETHWTSAAGAGHIPLVQADLVAARTGSSTIGGSTFSNRTVMFRYFVIEYMRGVDTLPAAFLTALAADFAVARAAGIKLVIRFSYSNDGSNTTPTGPYNTDTTPARTLGHISQLKPTIDAASDVLLAIEAGFIGTWGEWYYTDNWGNVGTLTTQQWNDRANLITALLGWNTGYILLRYPGLKHRYMQGTGLGANALTRLGFHNDAFLADAAGEDWGTYNTFANGQTVAQLKSYLTAETARPVLMMGETAGVSTRSTYANGSTEMDTYNWSTINPNYHPDVLATWTQANKDEASQKLGYRLRLASATLPTVGVAGGTANVTLSIVNDGWAAPIIDRPIQLVFVNGGTKVVRTLSRSTKGLVGTTTWSENVTLPGSGTWSIHLSMPDPALTDRTEFAIRLANTTTYSGVLNDLAASVNVSSGGSAVEGEIYNVNGRLYRYNNGWIDIGPLVAS